MARDKTQERINISASVLSQREGRLDWLKKRLDDAIADRTNMSENYLSIGSQKKYQDLNDRIAKLHFEIMLLEGGTIQDNHVAEWINNNRWKYQNPYNGEVRDFKVGDRFNLDYGGWDSKNNVALERSEWTGGNHYHEIWNADPSDVTNFQTFQLEKIKNKIEDLKISKTSNQIYQFDGESDDAFNLRKQDFNNKVWVKDGEIVKDWTPGAEQMLRSDFNRSTDLDSFRAEHNILNHSLIDSLKIRNNESKRDLSLTNGTQ